MLASSHGHVCSYKPCTTVNPDHKVRWLCGGRKKLEMSRRRIITKNMQRVAKPDRTSRDERVRSCKALCFQARESAVSYALAGGTNVEQFKGFGFVVHSDN